MLLFYTIAALAGFVSSTAAAPPGGSRLCRNLPGDRDWPSNEAWDGLNKTVGGRLLAGVPLAAVCYGPNTDVKACSALQNSWGLVDFFLDDPFGGVSPYFENNSCDPFVSPFVTPTSLCQLGNMASFAINVSDAATAAAGIQFAREKNIRLTIKNTGHDYLGGSVGKGSLALWTHHLKDVQFLNHSSPDYTGAAVKIGAGVQFDELYPLAEKEGLRVVGGSCPTVGAAGGWRQNGGHGPLSASYGLGADNALEYEVVIASGQHLIVSPQAHADLFYALTGGGAGTFAVVIAVTIRAFPDGPVAGSTLSFPNTNDAVFWAAVEAWIRHLLVLDTIPGFATDALISPASFSLVVATLPNATPTALTAALAPFYASLAALNITATTNRTDLQPSYFAHYSEYIGNGAVFTRNLTLGGRLIPRSLAQDPALVPQLASNFSAILAADPRTVIYLLGYNVTTARAGVRPGTTSVTPAWRDALFLINLVTAEDPDAPWPAQQADLAQMNAWQDRLRALTPGGGAYINEGTFDAVEWKADYFGGTYDRLRGIKRVYDPDFLFYVRPGVGADEFVEEADGRLCSV